MSRHMHDQAKLCPPPAEESLSVVWVCPLDDIPLGLGRSFEIGGREIAFFRTRTGGVFAVENRCPHRDGPLADGMLAGNKVVCPMHAFKFDLADGQCDQPGVACLETFAVSINQRWVCLEDAHDLAGRAGRPC